MEASVSENLNVFVTYPPAQRAERGAIDAIAFKGILKSPLTNCKNIFWRSSEPNI